ncbi:hypothetical protein O9993_04875 [Vibrio lentus]|nr:hypothetical protein [Vibrio lentus]
MQLLKVHLLSTSSGLNGVTPIARTNLRLKLATLLPSSLGGENGLKVGAASNRDVLTPFEAAGKYGLAHLT